MRVGYNPNKDKKIIKEDYNHQIIIPVYIPNQDDYFKDSLAVFELCIKSILKTSHDKTYITIVNNGSCIAVVNYIDGLFKAKLVHEIIHTSSIGKLNAIVKGISGHVFDLITITDADVLFLNNWQKQTYTIFSSIPKAGAVCPVPNSKLIKHLTLNILISYLFSNKLKFSKVENSEAMLKFEESIGNIGLFKMVNLEKYLTIELNKTKAVVGAGHFVTTYRGDLFNDLKRYSNFSLGGDSERVFLDEPVIKKGFWRLSTLGNYAYHMGNTLESWMQTEVEGLIKANVANVEKININAVKTRRFNNFKLKVFSKIMFRKAIWNRFLISKGLTKEQAKQY